MPFSIGINTQEQVVLFITDFCDITQVWALVASLKFDGFCHKLKGFFVPVLTFFDVVAKDAVVLALQEVRAGVLSKFLEDVVCTFISPLLEHHFCVALYLFDAGLQMFIYSDK